MIMFSDATEVFCTEGTEQKAGWLYTVLVGGELHSQPGDVSRGEKMLYSGTDPESYITEYSLVYEENIEPTPALLNRSSDARKAG